MLQSNVDFEYYFITYCGGQDGILSAANFEIYIQRAKNFLNNICTKEIISGYEDEVCAALCAIAEKLYQGDRIGYIKSESIDGYSVAYSEHNANKELFSIAALYLGKSGMLYAGVE